MIKKIRPELNILGDIAKRTLQESKNHAKEILKSEAKPSEIIGREIGNIIANGPSNIIKKIDEISAPISVIAKKTVEEIQQHTDPISQRMSDFIEHNPNLNPINIVERSQEAVKTYTKIVSENVDDIGKEITKTVVKEKIKKSSKKTFFVRICDFFKKIKNFIDKKLYKN